MKVKNNDGETPLQLADEEWQAAIKEAYEEIEKGIIPRRKTVGEPLHGEQSTPDSENTAKEDHGNVTVNEHVPSEGSKENNFAFSNSHQRSQLMKWMEVKTSMMMKRSSSRKQ